MSFSKLHDTLRCCKTVYEREVGVFITINITSFSGDDKKRTYVERF